MVVTDMPGPFSRPAMKKKSVKSCDHCASAPRTLWCGVVLQIVGPRGGSASSQPVEFFFPVTVANTGKNFPANADANADAGKIFGPPKPAKKAHF